MSERTSAECRDVLVEVSVDAPTEKVWRALVEDTGAWWHPDFYTGDPPRTFHIEPKLGGWVWEDWGGGAGQLWGVVKGIRPPRFLMVAGDSSRDFGGPHRSLMTWTLEEPDDAPGTTRLRLVDSVFGRVAPDTKESLEAGWLMILRDRLKPFVETGRVPEGAGADS